MTDDARADFRLVYRQVLALPREERWAFIESELADRPAIQARLKQLFSPNGEDLFLVPAEDFDHAPVEHQIRDGIQLGDFRLIRELGRGGVGVVYLAEQQSLGRQVALKLFRPSGVAAGWSVERFLDEARSIAKLRHPGVVPVYTVGEAAGFPYFALEYVPGRDLAEEVEASRQGKSKLLAKSDSSESFQAAARICAEVADALSHAHAQGILHRDIKPSNILLDDEGTARLTDFGLAKNFLDAPESISEELKGTVHYMSPEQLRQRRPQQDARSDVYALGVVLYEVLARKKPFEGSTFTQVLHAVQKKEPVPLRKLLPRVPRDLALICETAMAKRPEERYANAADFAADLRRFLAHEAISLEPPTWGQRAVRWSRRHKLPIAVTAMAVVSATLAMSAAQAWSAWRTAPRISVQAVDPQLSQILMAGEVSVRRIDPLTGVPGSREAVGRLPLREQTLAPGYYRIVVEYDDGWFTEHTRYLKRGEELAIQSVHRATPLLDSEDWATVASGTFRMPEDAPELWPFRGATVQLEGYRLARFEATNRQYREYLLATGRPSPLWWRDLPWREEWDALPVTYLRWSEFRDFAEWCGARLPTVHEWQRAAHGTRLRETTWVQGSETDWRGNTQGEDVLSATAVLDNLETNDGFLWVCEQLVAVEDDRGDVSDSIADAIPGLVHLVGNAREMTETLALRRIDGELSPDPLSRYTSGVNWEASTYGLSMLTVSQYPISDEYRQVTHGVRMARSLIP